MNFYEKMSVVACGDCPEFCIETSVAAWRGQRDGDYFQIAFIPGADLVSGFPVQPFGACLERSVQLCNPSLSSRAQALIRLNTNGA